MAPSCPYTGGKAEEARTAVYEKKVTTPSDSSALDAGVGMTPCFTFFEHIERKKKKKKMNL